MSARRSSAQIYLTLLLLIWPLVSFADVVKPALVEISAHTSGKVIVDVRVSLEALLTGINAKYKNTQDAPNAEEYDHYRKMSAVELRAAFVTFHSTLLSSVRLQVDGQIIPLRIMQIDIPEPGYTKVPRISTVLLQGSIPTNSHALYWYYPQLFGDNAVRVRQVDKLYERWHWSQWQWLKNDKTSNAFMLDELFIKRPLTQTIVSYIVLGFEHILPMGLDHILFIVGLFLLSTQLKPLLWQVTMFTLAHTITLGLAMNGLVELPARIVEPLIALSIAYVGIENILAKQLHKSRLVLVFIFGLLHGLGFAGVLKDFGMPNDTFVTSLISFNIGVELGQLVVIAIAYAAVFVIMKRPAMYRKLIVVPASFFISLVGIAWTIERLAV